MKKKSLIILISIISVVLLIGGGITAFVLTNLKPAEEFLIVLNEQFLQIKKGEEATLVATTNKPATITWTSANEEIATVNNGLVRALEIGQVTITATANKKSASCLIDVYEDGDFTISLNETSLTMLEGEFFQLIATTSEEANVTWSSDNDEVASVSDNGYVSAIKEGQALITASANDKHAYCAITVNKDTPLEDPITLSWGTIDTTNIDDLNNGEEKGPYHINLVTSSTSSDTFTGKFSVSLSSTSNDEYRLINYLYLRVYDNLNKENPLIDINPNSLKKEQYCEITMSGNQTKTLYIYIGIDNIPPYIFGQLTDTVEVTFDWGTM